MMEASQLDLTSISEQSMGRSKGIAKPVDMWRERWSGHVAELQDITMAISDKRE